MTNPKAEAKRIICQWCAPNGLFVDELEKEIEQSLIRTRQETIEECGKVSEEFKCNPPDVWDKEIREAIAQKIREIK